MSESRCRTPKPDLSPRKADKSWLPPQKRITSHLTNAEDVLPRSLDPMYQGMKRTNSAAKRALFANYRAEVNLQRSLGRYSNICREEVNNIRYDQRQVSRGFHEKQRRRFSILRARSTPQPTATEERKYSYSMPKRSVFGRSLADSDDSDSDDSIPSRPFSAARKKSISERPKTAPKPALFLTEPVPLSNNQRRKRPMTAMELIESSKPLQPAIDPDDIDQDKVRTSSYYRRVTSPSLRGVVSNQLAAYYKQMRIKI